MLNDPLSNVLSGIFNAEKVGKSICIVKPASKLVNKILEIMKKYNYIGSFEIINDNKGNLIKINLLGSINNCKVIKPRFAVKTTEFEKYEKRYLLAKDFGIIIVSTSKGLMTHNEAKEKGIGGKLICFVY